MAISPHRLIAATIPRRSLSAMPSRLKLRYPEPFEQAKMRTGWR